MGIQAMPYWVQMSVPVKNTLSKYNDVTIILDKDASSRAVFISGQCSNISYVRFTDKDLKLLSVVELNKVLV